MEIAAIETRYGGRHYRSRIEARWVVFLDVLGVEFEYEPEKFLIDGEPYIPDFFIPTWGDDNSRTIAPEGMFLEVKGAPPSLEALRKIGTLSSEIRKRAAIVHGQSFSAAIVSYPYGQLPASLNQCPFCGRFGFSTDGTAKCSVYSVFDHFCLGKDAVARKYGCADHWDQNIEIPRSSPSLDIAREAAMSARFESPEWRQEIEGWKIAVRRLCEQGIFSDPEYSRELVSEAISWKAAGLCYGDPPWWVQHQSDSSAGVHPCTCYVCVYENRRRIA
jgi:hypothetical protein